MVAEYIPPYDSPIENLFAFHFCHYARDDIEMIPQYAVETICGRFVLDFLLIDKSGYKVGVECDGRDFHNEYRDEWRDAMILGDNHLQAIYRLRGCDITYSIEDILYIMNELEPEYFNDRAKSNLSVLVSDKVQKIKFSTTEDHYFYHTLTDDGLMKAFDLRVRRNDAENSERKFWISAYNFAQKLGGGSLDDVMKCYAKQAT